MTKGMKSYIVAASIALGLHGLGTGLGWFRQYREHPIVDLRGMGTGGGSGGHSGWSGGGFRGGK